MKTVRPGLDPSETAKTSSIANRRLGIAAFTVLAVLLCSGSTAPVACTGSTGSIGPSTGEVVGAAVGIGAVIAVAIIVPVEISHSHHSLTGCVVTGPSGIELRTSDSKTYALEGDAASIKVGDRVKLHGSKAKKTKDTTGDQVFRVEKLNRDYGSCPVSPK
jgi:hypothetical protein